MRILKPTNLSVTTDPSNDLNQIRAALALSPGANLVAILGAIKGLTSYIARMQTSGAQMKAPASKTVKLSDPLTAEVEKRRRVEAERQLDKRAHDIAKKDGLPFSDAMQRAANEAVERARR